jgi:hypothetical protein
VAGQSLLRFEAGTGDTDARNIELPATLGPFRSVQSDENDSSHLLIGARSGVIRLDPQVASSPELYSAGNVTSQLGFNRVISWPSRGGLAASHSELGIIFWKFGQTERPESRIDHAAISSDAAGAKNLQILDDDRLIFAAGNRLLTSDMIEVKSLPTASSTDIIALLRDEHGILVIHEDATICRLNPATLSSECITRRSQRISAAAILPWLGTSRLLLATEDGSLECIGLDDSLVTQYQSPHRGLRAVCAAGGLVAALSGDRQRLILWNTWDGRRAIDEIFLLSHTRHRAAGINFG